MQNTAEVVIIGGGVHGCSIAYHLARKGYTDIVVLEKGYLTNGGTGRSAAGIRHQFGTEINIRLAAESIKMMEQLQEELEYPYDLGFRQGGYMMLAYSQTQLEQFEANVALQNELVNAGSRILSTQEVADIVPGINTQEGLLGASFNEKDGHIDPFHLTHAYAEAARRLGVHFYTQTEVIEVKTKDGRVTGVVTSRGDIQTPLVVNAAGPHGRIISNMVGLDVPMCPERHQILATEPVEDFLPCMVISLTHGCYCKQTPHGSLLLGVGDPNEVKDFNERSSWQFLQDVARKVTFHLPPLRKLRIVRQWAGLYDNTEDKQAILGETEVEGFYLDIGWSGHGLQLGPVVGKLMAQKIAGEEPDIDITPMSMDRFASGELIPEPACV
ncbi:MAG: FAD-binding oxidoreductase [Desulfovermiculus sp.]|nr:FAD-binding oxidoreductase [Desulfovermiculus sp.]